MTTVGSFSIPIISFFLCFLATKIPYLCPVDVPNQRSSHTKLTPRSGPILALLLLVFLLPIQSSTRVLFICLMLMGYVDDYVGMKPTTKFLFQIFLSLAILFVAKISLWWLVPVVALSNFNNFMDGINGLMLSQLFFTAAALYFFTPFKDFYLFASLILLGIIPGNFPKPIFFSGDSVSLSLPLILLVPILHHPLEYFLIFLTAANLFWVDAFYTLLARLKRREKFWVAHRSHAYQQLIIHGWSHVKVTILYGIVAAVNITSIVLLSNNFYSLLASFVISSSVWIWVMSMVQRSR